MTSLIIRKKVIRRKIGQYEVRYHSMLFSSRPTMLLYQMKEQQTTHTDQQKMDANHKKTGWNPNINCSSTIQGKKKNRPALLNHNFSTSQLPTLPNITHTNTTSRSKPLYLGDPLTRLSTPPHSTSHPFTPRPARIADPPLPAPRRASPSHSVRRAATATVRAAPHRTSSYRSANPRNLVSTLSNLCASPSSGAPQWYLPLSLYLHLPFSPSPCPACLSGANARSRRRWLQPLASREAA
jgi:hypothetical protein